MCRTSEMNCWKEKAFEVMVEKPYGVRVCLLRELLLNQVEKFRDGNDANGLVLFGGEVFGVLGYKEVSNEDVRVDHGFDHPAACFCCRYSLINLVTCLSEMPPAFCTCSRIS